jgi:hypothetical protein
MSLLVAFAESHCHASALHLSLLLPLEMRMVLPCQHYPLPCLQALLLHLLSAVP